MAEQRKHVAAERWIAKHQQGESNPVPSFCPNAPFIGSNGPRRARDALQAHELPEVAASNKKR